MCDYSLHETASRPAKASDKLVTHRFGFTTGFAEANDLFTAVCLLPGAEVVFEQDVECKALFPNNIFPGPTIKHRVARFRKINLEREDAHHDALEFPDGRITLLDRIVEGQRARVIQVPVLASPTMNDINAEVVERECEHAA